MKTKTVQLKLNVGFTTQQSVGFSREFHFEFPIIRLGLDFEVQDLDGKIKISRTSEGLLTRGVFNATTDAICSRCLENFKQLLKTDFTELFTFIDHVQDGTELIYPEDGQIDFAPILGEYLILEIPINPTCKQTCKGLCPICGNNLNTESCDHGPVQIDPRLEILKNLLDED
jgi:uncharacterized protein